MSAPDAQELTRFLRERVGDNLRSVVRYDRDSHDIVYVRDDVRRQYTEREILRVVRDLEVESLSREIQEDLYAHGDLHCTVRCFEGGVEMHFIAEEGAGVAVALDPDAMVAQGTFVGRCLELLGLDGETG